jgi:RNA polymerase sigma factor (sigma-70 family)
VFHHHHRSYQSQQQEDRIREAAAARRARDAKALERTVRAAAAGDSAAWSALMTRFGNRVRGVAQAHGLNAHDVDDVQQATWMRLLQHIDRVREPAAIGGWLDTTARRESLRVLRRAKRQPVLESDPQRDDHIDDQPAIEQEVVEAERSAALHSSVERLPDAQRALVRLLLAEPAPSYAEIAEALDIPIGSIGPTRQRSLARLRRDELLVRAVAVGNEE